VVKHNASVWQLKLSAVGCVLYILMNQVLVYTKETMIKLIHSLEQLRDIGNSVIVVEHDKDMIERADYVIDIGPKAGKYGGEIISKGTLPKFETPYYYSDVHEWRNEN
jgi:excinuclease UvrABC ATPase subunit